MGVLGLFSYFFLFFFFCYWHDDILPPPPPPPPLPLTSSLVPFPIPMLIRWDTAAAAMWRTLKSFLSWSHLQNATDFLTFTTFPLIQPSTHSHYALLYLQKHHIPPIWTTFTHKWTNRRKNSTSINQPSSQLNQILCSFLSSPPSPSPPVSILLLLPLPLLPKSLSIHASLVFLLLNMLILLFQ